MKRLLTILTLFLFFINTSVFAASSVVKKELKYVTPDGFSINALLEYPNVKKQKEFKTVVLLHSLGYNSEWWDTLPQELLKQGYAVLMADLRGHGKSVYNSKLVRVSWKSMTNKAYSKYPDDVVGLINFVKNDNTKKTFFNDWAIVGVDIGAATGIIAANKSDVKPKTIVMLSPVVEARGVYAPVNFAELSNIDVLSICGMNDISSMNAQDYLKRFAQSGFVEYTSESKASGMLMLKADKGLAPFISEWIKQYLK